MPKPNVSLGYALIIIGVVLLLFTFYLGWNFYSTVLASISSSGSGQNILAAAPSGTGMIAELGISGFLLLVIVIIILLVLISIGGRLVKYGIDMLNVNRSKDDEEDEEQSVDNGKKASKKQ